MASDRDDALETDRARVFLFEGESVLGFPLLGLAPLMTAGISAMAGTEGSAGGAVNVFAAAEAE